MQTTQDRFACNSCGRQFRWKLELAGKSAKCVCGQPVFIPASLEPAVTDDLYAFVEEDPARVIPLAPPVQTGPATLGYQAVESSSDDPLDLAYDLFLPGGVLLVAAILISLHGGLQGRFLVRLVGQWFLIAITVLPSIIAFIVYGAANSRRLKISNTAFAIAALKLFTVVLITDAAILFAYDYLKSVGALKTSIFGILGLLSLFLGCVGLTIKGATLCFFHRPRDKFGKAAFTIAALSWVIQATLIFVVNSVVIGMIGARKVPPAANATPARAPTMLPSTSDRAIMQAVSQGLLVREAREWKNLRLSKTPELDALIDGLYSAGANKVYIDMRNGGIVHPVIAYVELPADPVAQTACLSTYQTYTTAMNLPRITIVPSTLQKFTIFPLRY